MPLGVKYNRQTVRVCGGDGLGFGGICFCHDNFEMLFK